MQVQVQLQGKWTLYENKIKFDLQLTFDQTVDQALTKFDFIQPHPNKSM